MTTTGSSSLSRDIRRYVLEMLLVLVFLVIFGVVYKAWSRHLLSNIETQIDDFHLVATAHYLKAEKELRKIQALAGSASGDEADADSQAATPGLYSTDTKILAMHNIALKEIFNAMALEDYYSDARFTLLRERLGQQHSTLNATLAEAQNQRRFNIIALPVIKKTTVTLNQMVRLHGSAHDSLIELHIQSRQKQNIIFYLLISLLLLCGVVISYRSLRAIGVVIRAQEESEEKIRHQAHYDALTELPNRFLTLDRLSRMICEAERDKNKVAVLFLDLDFFKKVNDMLGHVSGDKLLVEAAARLQRSVRDSDTVGRMGGDEFMVLVGGLNDTDEVRVIAENIIRKMGDAFEIDGKELMLSASVGISLYPDDGSQNLELIRKADSAMYHSKREGRNTYSYFTEEMNESISRRLSLEEQLYGALDRGEFEVYYQQKVDVASQKIVGAEALLRWNNEVLGAVSPDEFIPMAEQTGAIVPIGEFVITEALKMTRQWQKSLPGFNIAVNISPRQFRSKGLVNHISRALLESGVSSRNLELEITEGVLMSENQDIDGAIAELTALGITLAMDDFGTGYSSLSYLRDYPFGVIKIDRSFISDLNSNATSEQLNNATIAMAHALNIKVVAEGVETKEQLEVLQTMHCDVAQGYYFGKPVRASEVTKLLESRSEIQAYDNVHRIGESIGAT